MKEYIEKQNTQKEYTAPQMEVVDCKVQTFLCGSGGDIVECTENVDCD